MQGSTGTWTSCKWTWALVACQKPMWSPRTIILTKCGPCSMRAMGNAVRSWWPPTHLGESMVGIRPRRLFGVDSMTIWARSAFSIAGQRRTTTSTSTWWTICRRAAVLPTCCPSLQRTTTTSEPSRPMARQRWISVRLEKTSFCRVAHRGTVGAAERHLPRLAWPGQSR